MKKDYELAKIEIIMFESSDIVTTSGEFTENGNIDEGGWT